MRSAWLVATLQYLAPYLAGAIVVAAVIDWLSPTDLVLVSVAVAAALAVLGCVSWSLVKPVSDWQAARTAERGLDAHDSLTTALEFHDEDKTFHKDIQRRADEVVASSRPRDAIRFMTDRKRMRNAAALAAAALVIGFLPPLGSSPALSAGVEEALDAEADELERIAEALDQADVEKGREIADNLRQLAKELRESRTTEEALRALDPAT